MSDKPAKSTEFPIGIGETFRAGWHGYRSNFVLVSTAGGVVWLVVLGAIFLGASLENGQASVFVQLTGLLLASAAALPWYRSALDAVDDEASSIGRLLREPERFATLFGASIFFWASVLFALRYFGFLAGPGALLVLGFYAFYGFVVADSRRGVAKSLGQSVLLGQGRRIGIFAIGSLLVLVNFLAILPIGSSVTPVTGGLSLVLLVFTSSYSIVCGAVLYRALDRTLEARK